MQIFFVASGKSVVVKESFLLGTSLKFKSIVQFMSVP